MAGPPSLQRRRSLQGLCGLLATPSWSALLSACGGGSSAAGTPAPAPAPAPSPSPAASPVVQRLQAALATAPLRASATQVTVSQGAAQSATSSFGASAAIAPPLLNPQGLSLATLAQLWGWRRDLWTVQAGAAIASNPVLPVSRAHPAATLGSTGVCALHFSCDGSSFEVLFAGSNPQITLVADGQYMASGVIQTTLGGSTPGQPLAASNAFVRFDFGSAAPRRISVYARSSQGPCAIAVAAGGSLQAWDRSTEPSFAAITDSYGGAFAPNWGVSGPYWEAAAQLGIPHLDVDAIGGTGYAPNSGNSDTLNPGNAFAARLPTSVNAMPDLFLTAGGINDNNAYALPPYASAAAAAAGFDTAVAGYFSALRAALSQSVLVALGPWAPKQSIPTDPVAQAKADSIRAALAAAGPPWVFLDNLNGGWRNSSGASATDGGPWQTGTGNSAAPAGDGNGDLYLLADGVHPNLAGCLYLGTRIATDLRAALLAL